MPRQLFRVCFKSSILLSCFPFPPSLTFFILHYHCLCKRKLRSGGCKCFLTFKRSHLRWRPLKLRALLVCLITRCLGSAHLTLSRLKVLSLASGWVKSSNANLTYKEAAGLSRHLWREWKAEWRCGRTVICSQDHTIRGQNVWIHCLSAGHVHQVCWLTRFFIHDILCEHRPVTTGTVEIQGTHSLPFRNLVSSQQSKHQSQQALPTSPYLVFQWGGGGHSNSITYRRK